jgi:hypothetical protein
MITGGCQRLNSEKRLYGATLAGWFMRALCVPDDPSGKGWGISGM